MTLWLRGWASLENREFGSCKNGRPSKLGCVKNCSASFLYQERQEQVEAEARTDPPGQAGEVDPGSCESAIVMRTEVVHCPHPSCDCMGVTMTQSRPGSDNRLGLVIKGLPLPHHARDLWRPCAWAVPPCTPSSATLHVSNGFPVHEVGLHAYTQTDTCSDRHQGPALRVQLSAHSS